MKTAICYDDICTKGGHEKVVLTLAKAFNADIYTMKYEVNNTFVEFKEYEIHSNELKYNTYGLKLLGKINNFKKIDLSNYDLVISNGGWSRQVARSKNNPPIIDYNPGIPGFCKYIQKKGIVYNLWTKYIKKMDKESAWGVDKLIANSYFVKNVFQKIYGRNADVIYPPVNIKKFRKQNPENFFLSVQRFSPQKRIELQVDIFKKLPEERLIILGPIEDYSYFEKIKENSPLNVEFISSDSKLIEMYSKCKGVIQTGKGEPFGLVPVEAMASGKPCMAVNEGGFMETILNEKTGLLIDPPYIDNFMNAIQKFDNYSFDPKVCQERAMEFSEELFIKKIKSEVDSVLIDK
jgi:glycosyltransferase involved in cell wall biosynthesis